MSISPIRATQTQPNLFIGFVSKCQSGKPIEVTDLNHRKWSIQYVQSGLPWVNKDCRVLFETSIKCPCAGV